MSPIQFGTRLFLFCYMKNGIFTSKYISLILDQIIYHIFICLFCLFTYDRSSQYYEAVTIIISIVEIRKQIQEGKQPSKVIKLEKKEARKQTNVLWPQSSNIHYSQVILPPSSKNVDMHREYVRLISFNIIFKSSHCDR